MMEAEFSSWVAENGWKHVDKTACGVYNGCPFAIQQPAANAARCVMLFQTAKGLKGRTIRAMKKALPKGYKVNQPQVGQFHLTIPSAGSQPDRADFSAVMNVVTSALREAEAAPVKKCAICGGEDCDQVALSRVGVLLMNTPVHQNCVHSRVEQTDERVTQNRQSGNYLTGLVGALLGGLVGTIPSLVTIVAMNTIYALLYALIPLAAYQGYKLFRGKMNKGALVVTVVASAANLFVMEHINFCFYIYDRYGYLPRLARTIRMYWGNMSGGDFILVMGQSLLFLVLGIFMVWGRISRTATHELQDMALMADSMQPLQASGRPATPHTPERERVAPREDPWL